MPPKALFFACSYAYASCSSSFKKSESKRVWSATTLSKSYDNLGYDQGSVMIADEMSFSSMKYFESRCISEGQDQILADFETFFSLSRGRVGVRSPRGALYWRSTLRQTKVPRKTVFLIKNFKLP